jgi:acid phosphatase type 7
MLNPRFTVATALACSALLLQAPPALTQQAADIVLRPGTSAVRVGAWGTIADATAAGGVAVRQPNAGAAKISSAVASPASYFEVTFNAQAATPYHLWIRARATSNHWANDSVFVQFSGSVTTSGSAIYRIGTTSAATVNLEDCSGCGVSGWGWQDNGYGAGVSGPDIRFGATGPQTIRVQPREDGVIIDQIVLSPQRYLSASPGALKNDTTIVGEDAAETPTVTLVRGPYLQQATSSTMTVVWATRESGPAEVAFRPGGGSERTAPASSRRVSATTSGLAFDYFQHEARLSGLAAATTYSYVPSVGGTDLTAAASTFRTAPATGTGSVSFIIFGDSGTGSAEQRQLAQRMQADTFDIALHAGDIVYGATNGTGDASYRTFGDWFFDVYRGWLARRPFFPAEGNHDSRPSNGNGRAYLDLFSLPRNGASGAFPDHAERYYSFDYGPVHFVALDTEFAFQDVTRRAEQLSWLEADLAATAQPWKVAFFHRSPYSAGGEHGSDTVVRAAFGPLFERYGVQLAMSAHEHDYERSRPWRESTTGSPVTYIVSGGGGAPLYPAGTAEWTAFSARRHQYVRARADACTIQIDAVGLDGSRFDGTTLSRCSAPPPPPPAGSSDVILYAADAVARAGAWRLENDATAAGGRRLRHPNASAAKLTAPLASPANYFDLTFQATAGTPYRLWIRGKPDANSYNNDSVYVQFDRSTTAAGAARFRIGTTSATTVVIEDCGGCGVAGWGWQDNGYGTGVFGDPIYFSATGPQRIRIQTREDGLAIDQVVLSPERYFTRAPGALKNDTTILIRP